MKDCILCKLIEEKIEVSKVFENDKVCVVLDIQPINPGHVLIIPKKCVKLITELSDDIIADMFIVAKKIDSALRKSGLKCQGVNFFLADGEAAFQEIPHVHLHVFPRFFEDGFGLSFPERYFKLPLRKELNEIAEKIKACL